MQVYTHNTHAIHSNPKQQHMKQQKIPFHTAEAVASKTTILIFLITINTNLPFSNTIIKKTVIAEPITTTTYCTYPSHS